MAFDPITAVINLGSTLIDRLLPDKQQNDAAKAQLAQMIVAGDIQTITAQLQVNQVEAGNQNVFVAGWRPFVGWVCGAAFAYAFVLQPFITTIAVLCHSSFDKTKLPILDMAEMSPVLLGMLGLGAMRSYDKQNGNGGGH